MGEYITVKREEGKLIIELDKERAKLAEAEQDFMEIRQCGVLKGMTSDS